MKKRSGVLRIGFLALVLIVFLMNISFVSAYYFPQVRDISQGVVDTYIDVFEPVLQALLGGEEYYGLLLFEKLLIFIILLALIYVILGKVPVFEDQTSIKWIIAVIVPLLGVRFMSFEWVNTILIQYQVLGIALASILPFMIYFFFLHNVGADSPTIRKMGWILFIVVYLGLWISAETESYGAVYFWTGVASLIFLFFDGTIHRYYIQEEMRRSGNTTKAQQIAAIRRDIDEVQDDINHGYISSKVGHKIMKQKRKDLAWIEKNL
ncbi:hypothetical protein CMI45_00320 [Candidatus Pacearchaeota archaeon]|nr:hypothetical protein [Candidatus Pacearchaeota archaeon]|tara:strand:- start:7158 stop:7952 length:795 start_codon:yes stop_codon:yes gene_type:complete